MKRKGLVLSTSSLGVAGSGRRHAETWQSYAVARPMFSHGITALACVGRDTGLDG
jgi:hypothetical protein